MFEENMKGFASRIEDLRDNIYTEEATKTSLVMPFFQILGYDVFNPSEFTPEFTADVGIKKGEKVDYAIILDDKPSMLIEVKPLGSALDKHATQLYRYFSTTRAKFAILTNGQNYKFYTDLDDPNKLDELPFLEIDLCKLKDSQINELKKFHKDNFNENNISDAASELKYVGLIRAFLKKEFSEPSDEFVRFALDSGVYQGRKSQNVVDKFKPMVKKSLQAHINELVNERIQSAIQKEEIEDNEPTIEDNKTSSGKEIITTDEEIEAYYIVKAILAGTVDVSRIYYKDTLSYFSILLDDKVTKWICRLYLKDSTSYVVVPESDNHVRYDIESIEDLYYISKDLIRRVKEMI